MICKRSDFVFSIAFNKEAIVVNKRLKKRFANKPFLDILEKGLFRQALSMAIFDDNEEQLQKFIHDYGALIGNSALVLSDVKKIFGIHDVPSSVKAVQLV